jgi:dipeptide/tripeptide permease
MLSLSIGSFMAGQLAKLTSIAGGAQAIDIATALPIYIESYKRFGYIALAAGIVLYLLSPVLYGRMHEADAQYGTSLIARFYARILPTSARRSQDPAA